MKKNHLISILDLSAEESLKIFKLAVDIKKNPAKYQSRLQGQMFALIFEKPSTRTWVSFETGIYTLGGSAIYLGPEDMKLGIREEVKDVARVLSRYISGVVLRTFSHKTITEFRKYFQQTVINGLSDYEHPCQALADYMTIFEKFNSVTKPTLAFIGDGNNVFNSLVLLAAQLGGKINYATPKAYAPCKEVLAQAQKIAKKTGAVIKGSFDPVEAVGEEKIRNKKLRQFKGMQVNSALMKKANPGAYVMHCLPAHRGEEITDEVMESRRSIVFDQAENRLHAQKAVLLHLSNQS
jgi:ornithine carbamoyltransferase